MWTPSLAITIAIIYKSERGTFDLTASQCPQTFGHLDLYLNSEMILMFPW